MNAKEAEKIRNRYTGKTYATQDSFLLDAGHAEGFLEAIKKFKPVVEALEKIAKHDGWKCKDEAADALKSYRRNILGEE